MSDDTERLIAEFKAKGGVVTTVPDKNARGRNSILVQILKARPQTREDNTNFASYFFVKNVGDYPIPLPETFGVASTLGNLEKAKVGEVFVMPVVPYSNTENATYTTEHNIIFRTIGEIYKPGEKPEVKVKRVSVAAQKHLAARAKEKAGIQQERAAFNAKAKQPTREEILEKATAEERIRWALNKHGKNLGLTASFGIQSAVLLHMVHKISPNTKIVFIDTQHLHPETYRYKRDLVKQLGLTLHTYRADMSAAEQIALFGERWTNGLANDLYKYQNKVEPMNRAKAELGITGWISGRRREQSELRSHISIVEQDGLVEKINPLADWTEAQIVDYMNEHQLPFHPLSWEGYRTIGDYFENPDIRAECGLHINIENFDPKI